MLYVRNNSNQRNSGFPPILDLMPGMDPSPYAHIAGPKDMVRREIFNIPVGEGWSDDAYMLRFVIPGVERSAFELMFQGNRLVLRGERRKPDPLQSSDFNPTMQYGRFETILELPTGLDLKRMTATFHLGLLDVQIPAMDEMKARAVPIATNEMRASPAVV